MALIHFKSGSCVFSRLIQVRVLSILHLVIPISFEEGMVRTDGPRPMVTPSLGRSDRILLSFGISGNTNVTSRFRGPGCKTQER
jgi:hypothetical protein